VAGRLARARALLARRLVRHAGAVSSGSVAAVLAQNAASACVSESLVHSTARAASLLAAGAATAVISARVAALTEGVVRAMFLAKLKTVTCVLALTVLVGLGGVALVPGGGQLPAAGAATAPQAGGDAKPEAEDTKLVRQLGNQNFAKRQAAERALTDLGARAAAAVRAGMGDADPEVAKRCAALWPRLWQAEIARPDADRLAGYTHPLWTRFRKVAGDGPDSRTLFAEMAAEVNRFSRLETAEADPEKASAAYAAELKQRAEAIERGYAEARAAQERRFTTGMLAPHSGIPTRGEFVTLLFLGTYPATAKDENAGDTHNNAFAWALKSTSISPALRRLYATWLGTRTDHRPITIGMNLAVYHNFPEVARVAATHAANAELAPGTRAFALLAVGRFGKPDDLPLLEKAFTDSRVYHTTRYTFNDGKQKGIEVRVSDTAVAAALVLAGQHPADFGFTFQEMYKRRGPQALAEHYLLGFFQDDDTARQAAYKRAREWLDKHIKEKPRQQS
jgi:hypothetical protein